MRPPSLFCVSIPAVILGHGVVFFAERGGDECERLVEFTTVRNAHLQSMVDMLLELDGSRLALEGDRRAVEVYRTPGGIATDYQAGRSMNRLRE